MCRKAWWLFPPTVWHLEWICVSSDLPVQMIILTHLKQRWGPHSTCHSSGQMSTTVDCCLSSLVIFPWRHFLREHTVHADSLRSPGNRVVSRWNSDPGWSLPIPRAVTCPKQWTFTSTDFCNMLCSCFRSLFLAWTVGASRWCCDGVTIGSVPYILSTSLTHR